MRRRAQVQGVGSAQEEARLEGVVRPQRRGGMSEGGEDGLGRGVDGAARPLVAAPGGAAPRGVPRAAHGARGRRPPRRPLACRPTAPRRPWCGRRAPPRQTEGPGAWPPWRTRTRRPPSSRRPWPPRTVRPRPGRPRATRRSRRAGTRRWPARSCSRSDRCTTPARGGCTSRACGEGDHSSRWRPARARASPGWPARPGSSSCRSGSVRPRRATGPSRPRCPRAAPRRAGHQGGGDRAEGRRPPPAAVEGRAAWPSGHRAGDRGGTAAAAATRRPTRSPPAGPHRGPAAPRLRPGRRSRPSPPSSPRRCRRCAVRSH